MARSSKSRQTIPARTSWKASATIFLGFVVLIWAICPHVFTPKPTDLSTGSPGPRGQPPRYAFATILTRRSDLEYPDVKTPYLQATRLLSFQLLRNPRTRTKIPNAQLIILVTSEIPESDRDILRRDGALVIPVETLPFSEKYKDVPVPVGLNIWQLSEYDKVLYLDPTSVVLDPLDDIFEDTTTTIIQMTIDAQDHLPQSYMMAGWNQRYVDSKLSDGGVRRDKIENLNAMSTGFFVTHPSSDMFEYYIRLLHSMEQSSFDHLTQSILNYAHRTDGPMPWRSIGPGWSMTGPSRWDIENGLRSINHAWWRPAANEAVQGRIEETMDEMAAYLNH
ncbi:hypothetical protein N7468_000706 [Penicillium chermesinum]|uniref:Glycosyltransferase family 8 protein n=1 Tax=Penicillium chermesinum TaxID=63820 RepID=A0A9W9PKU5_9EURO|nr:uncharacterized protein N7468_000706 [Penicillium chermesinum]KAJ5249255.1 hypothetical protein N7468_000706 [Penicillium chermesinum]KAJ6151344.1 hypothetical protein N7470_007938 [Penicillium chermesinum]